MDAGLHGVRESWARAQAHTYRELHRHPGVDVHCIGEPLKLNQINLVSAELDICQLTHSFDSTAVGAGQRTLTGMSYDGPKFGQGQMRLHHDDGDGWISAASAELCRRWQASAVGDSSKLLANGSAKEFSNPASTQLKNQAKLHHFRFERMRQEHVQLIRSASAVRRLVEIIEGH